ncbi:MAG: tRNA (guanosine(46)-N7)-methyltransferase TrmB [Gammaproteobacteria bacterium]|nr:tRNA (guanosine(46)-N7)-methyltransferase TrmB [Gammaproteobacteria bacterium]
MVASAKRNLSFVRREGRLTAGQQNAISRYWPTYGLHSDQGQLNPEIAFGRHAPCVLEVGFGNGENLLSQARAHPDINFIGIEVYRSGIGSLLATAGKEDIENIRIYCEDAVDILQRVIVDDSLAALQIFFPDPWPKRRHHKRRLIQAAFVTLLRRKLMPGATLHIASDWQHYADHIKQIMATREDFSPFNDKMTTVLPPLQRAVTKFEQRGQRLGHNISDLRYVAC